MQHPLIVNDSIICLPPVYFGSVGYYALMASHAKTVIDCSMAYDKRKKYVHRCEIVDTRHRIFLTVPVSKMPLDVPCGEKPRWCDFKVSDHDQWWMLHRVALESAYGRTPFFEFYAPQIMELLTPWAVGRGVVDLACDTDRVVRRLLHLPTDVVYNDNRPDDAPVLPPYPARDVEYYQIRADKLGFQPRLSILDLLFNCGPESQFVLKEMYVKGNV